MWLFQPRRTSEARISRGPAPIQEIPEDILIEIFLWCLPSHRWKITLSPKEAPVLLTHVCRRWRHIIIRSALLWSWLRIQLQNTSDAGLRSLGGALLKRSKESALNLQIIIPQFTHHFPSFISPLILPITQSLTRLALKDVPISQLRSLTPGLFPNLERLALRFQPDAHAKIFRSSADSGPIKAFEDAPLLRYTAFYKPSAEGVDVLLPWPQLTHSMDVDLNSKASYRFLTQRLPLCADLRWLAIELGDTDLGWDEPEAWDHIPTTSMETVESLSLNFWKSHIGTPQYPDFFSKFQFPNVRGLRLEGGDMDFGGGHAWTPELVEKFIDKVEKFKKLEYLSLCLTSISQPTLERISKLLPRVTTLDLQIFENFENVFETLTLVGSDSTQHLLPHLHTLILEIGASEGWEFSGKETVNPLTFEPFLDSRMHCAVKEDRLQKIVVYGIEEEQFSDERPFIGVLQRYAREGLVVEIRDVSEQRGSKYNAFWMERDPGLQDWQEAGIAG